MSDFCVECLLLAVNAGALETRMAARSRSSYVFYHTKSVFSVGVGFMPLEGIFNLGSFSMHVINRSA